MATSIRLTNFDRDSIVSKAITGAFEARGAEIKTAEDVLARRCYDAVFSAKDRKAAAAMPAGWLRLDPCLRFNVGGMDVRLDVIGDGLPVPAGRGGNCRRLGSVADADLVGAVTTHLAAVEALKEAKSKARSSLKGLVYSVNTLKALRELWPEGEPYFSWLANKAGSPGLPAPQISELNAMLGLAEAA